jgi:hypothetical protein
LPTERVEHDEWYATMREQRYGGLLALAWELGRKPLQREVAELLGISRSYAASITNDLDGSLERTRKARYAGVCEKCGGSTDGSNGRAKAPRVCLGCLMGDPENARRLAEHRPPRKIWNEEKCEAAILAWVEEHQMVPRAYDFVKAVPGRFPCIQTIMRYCYRYEERPWRREWQGTVSEGTSRWLTRSFRDLLVDLAPRMPTAAIVNAHNAWLRMRLFEAVGVETIVRTAGKRITSDEIGVLWRITDERWPEPIVMVEVRNSTPEPDGTFKTYFLRVPPDTRTPRAGIAWTFEMAAEEYEPAAQT